MAACQLPRPGKGILGTVISRQLGFQTLVNRKVLFAARRGHDAGHNQQGSQDAFARDRFAQPLGPASAADLQDMTAALLRCTVRIRSRSRDLGLCGKLFGGIYSTLMICVEAFSSQAYARSDQLPGFPSRSS